MIDPISAFAMLTSAHSALKKCVSMGKDLSSATSAIASYAKAEAELGFAKEQKKKGIFGSVMDQAIEQHFKEEEQKLIKNKKIAYAIFVIMAIMAFLIKVFVLVDPIVPSIFLAAAIVAALISWRFDYKVKKIKEEIAALEKE